ncbi:MAG TPA: nickel pincer cofactor biosynthesis protein LarC [Acidimicrobiales bacterium]|nr:nickel pincer cofactor biosynthesis protein LarC [Acidimicrobiales bacterium]
MSPSTPDGVPRNGRTTVAWFHCFSGIAGDMALGSLVDAGADVDEVVALLRRIPFGGWRLRVEHVLRGGIDCTRVVVTGADDVVVRTHAHIVGLLSEARLPERVTSRALAVFGALAEVEARLHRRSAQQVHFHEVGGHDAIVDIVGTAAALEVLDVDEVTASAVATGTGTVRSAHGLLPNPSPAVVRLLEGVPTYGRQTTVELTTPTGAAILAGLATSFGPLPPMEVRSTGFGAGHHDLADLPNCTQVVVGAAQARSAGDGGQPVVVLEANLDDATGEQLAHAVATLLEAGALDAWVTPVVMKKGRPGHIVHALCDPVAVAPLRQVFQTTTGTFGVRAVAAERWPTSRSMDAVDVDGETVRMKVGPHRTKPEFDDVARTSNRTGRPLHEVASLAEEAWRRSGASSPEGPGDTEDPEPA